MNTISFFSIEEIEELSKKINEKTKLPVIGEKTEAFVFRTLIREMERLLWLRHAVSLKKVLTGTQTVMNEAQSEIDKLVDQLNKTINIPLMGEKKEKKLMEAIIKELGTYLYSDQSTVVS